MDGRVTISQAITNNRLSMHSGKTEVIVFSSKRKRSRISNFSIILEDNEIKPQSTVKYLGLKIGQDLSGDSIVDDIVSKCSARLKFFYRHQGSLNLKSRKTLVSALVQCYFDYSVSSWFYGLTNKR